MSHWLSHQLVCGAAATEDTGVPTHLALALLFVHRVVVLLFSPPVFVVFPLLPAGLDVETTPWHAPALDPAVRTALQRDAPGDKKPRPK